ncbi:MAG: glycosyltransferase family 4 protein [Candidatus Omnitrophica bacterium]|nr:glycosyltransferase family 4 protein [Candidatus Omnitrophota bacterium]
MRVLLISKWVAGGTKGDFYYPGVWRDTFELSLALRRCGLEVAILTSKIQAPHLSRFDREFGYELRKNKIEHFISDFSAAFGYDWGYFRLKFFLSELRTISKFKPDVIQYMQFGPSILYHFVRKPIIFYSCYLNGSYLGQKEDLAAKEKDWGVRYSFFSILAFIFLNIFYVFLTKFFGSMNLKQALKRRAVLVFMHKKGYRRAREEFGNNKALYYIQKGIDYFEILKKIKNIKPKKNKLFKVLFMGSIFYGKGIFDLVRAFKEVEQKNSQTELLIVGTGPKSLVSKLKKIIKSLKLETKIRYYGSLNYHKKWRFYLESDIFCLPSYSDSYPSVIFEAAVCGLPVITTYEIDSPVENGKSGILVNSGDIKAISQAILTLRDKKLRKVMLKNIKKEIAKYNWENAAAEFVSLYKKLC